MIRATLIALIGTLLAGCLSLTGVPADRLNTANKQLADKALFVKSVARLTRNLVVSGVVSQEQGRQAADTLQNALELIQETQRSVAVNGDPSQAEDAIARVDSSLAILLDLLVMFAPAETSTLFEEHEYAYS